MRRNCIAIAAAMVASLHAPTASAAEPVHAVEIVEASAFLEAYRAASDAQSAEFYDLYSDRAVIHARGRDQEPGLAFPGRQFKAWGRALLASRRAGLDGSIFREVTVEERGSRLLIRAKRYSTTRCYWDPTYQVSIEREGAAYRIVDERLTTRPTAQCLSAPMAFGRSQPMPDAAPGTSAAVSAASRSSADSALNPEWHPMSEQDLADKSLRLAQQLAARTSRPPSESVAPTSVMASAAAAHVEEARPAAGGAVERVNPLRITPKD